MTVAGAPRQAGALQPEYEADLAQADLRDQALKARPVGLRSARRAHILIDHHDPFGGPAERLPTDRVPLGLSAIDRALRLFHRPSVTRGSKPAASMHSPRRVVDQE